MGLFLPGHSGNYVGSLQSRDVFQELSKLLAKALAKSHSTTSRIRMLMLTSCAETTLRIEPIVALALAECYRDMMLDSPAAAEVVTTRNSQGGYV